MKPLPPPSSRLEHGMVVRWTRLQVAEHLVIGAALLALGLTGLALKFHDQTWAALVFKLMGGVPAAGVLHRVCAVALMLTVVFHAVHAAVTEYGHQELMRIKMQWQDFRDLRQTIRFNLGLADRYPPMGKYTYQEKFHYWAFALVVLLMIPSGMVLMLQDHALLFFPKWVWDVTLIFHGGGGLFFFLVLLLAHLYHVHLDPRVFPMSWTWLTGTMTEEQLQELHPLEYDALKESSPE